MQVLPVDGLNELGLKKTLPYDPRIFQIFELHYLG